MKKVKVIMGMMVISILTFSVFAYGTERFPLCTDPACQGQSVLYENIVVWRDYRNDDGDIYGYDLMNSSEFFIPASPGYQWHPAIYKNVVLWEYWTNNDNSLPAYLHPEDIDDIEIYSDIYGYDLETQTEFPICTDSDTQWDPKIYGNTVIWHDWKDIYGTMLEKTLVKETFDTLVLLRSIMMRVESLLLSIL